MDLAYDHIQESALSPDEAAENGGKKAEQSSSLNTDFQEAYKAISSSPWGSRLGGFFGNVVKQGENVYREVQHEVSAVGEEASKGLTNLQSTIINRTRGLSINQNVMMASSSTTAVATTESGPSSDKTIQESEGVLARLKSEAAKRLKEIEKAEDAADEALLKFGTNIRNFLKDAVTIAPPAAGSQSSTILFESKDAQGKRVIHTTRFDAQLHVIHSSLDSFTSDPISSEYAPWSLDFNVESKTADISDDLEKYTELRAAMEKLVPDVVTYADFWKRYYFLRHSIETAEARRRDLLKGAATAEEEIGWDEESDDEEAPSKSKTKPTTAQIDGLRPASMESSITIQPHDQSTDDNHLKVTEWRKSHDEKSQADSDASYDVVGATSGAPSHAPGSPKESKKGEDSEEDWE